MFKINRCIFSHNYAFIKPVYEVQSTGLSTFSIYEGWLIKCRRCGSTTVHHTLVHDCESENLDKVLELVKSQGYVSRVQAMQQLLSNEIEGGV